VRRLTADYLAPARFDDTLGVETRLVTLGGARIVLDQAVLRGAIVLFRAEVTLACLDRGGRAVRLPAEIRRLLGP